MFPSEHCVLHIMDTKTRLSAGVICADTLLSNAIYALQIGWLTPFWIPASIRAGDGFNHTKFIYFVKSIGSQFEPILPRHHNKNVLDSKHSILRLVFIPLSQEKPVLLMNKFVLPWLMMFATSYMDPKLCRLMKWLMALLNHLLTTQRNFLLTYLMRKLHLKLKESWLEWCDPNPIK